MTSRSTRPHGTLSKAKVENCTCEPCHEADRRYANRRYRLMAYGQWQPYVDAEPVRAHVRLLREFGVGARTLAKIAGVPTGSMSKLIYGDGPRGMAPSKRVRPSTAAAILAIEPTMDLLADGAMIDGAGTRRRLQALIAVGWSQNQLAERVGIERNQISRAVHGAPLVRCGTARTVRDVYSELWNQPPPEPGHREKIAAARSRNYAREHGWHLPAAWDDDLIDLPDADLAIELRRRAELMTDLETGRCYRSRRHEGDNSPLTVAGSSEYLRRRGAKRAAA